MTLDGRRSYRVAEGAGCIPHLGGVVHLEHEAVLVVEVAAEASALAGALAGEDGDALEILDMIYGHGKNLVAVRTDVDAGEYGAEIIEVHLGLEPPCGKRRGQCRGAVCPSGEDFF